ncbi:telomerase reverse transcriptase-like [Rhopilema esculentum]|uniref:telomerase reverse transcriptase-like n=1 Tax=Rhopilema esculentum TaxID=499914 RepID=UPI0031D55619
MSWKDHAPVIGLLDQYYCWTSSLEIYLRYVFSCYKVPLESQAEVFKSDDVKGLLADTIVSCRCCSVLVPDDLVLFHCQQQQLEIVEGILHKYCKRFDRKDHAGKSFEKELSAAASLAGKEWEALSFAIGSDLMMHLLSQMALFIKLPKGNLLQVTGKSLWREYPLGDHSCRSMFQESVDRFVPGLIKVPSTRMSLRCQINRRDRTLSTESESILEDEDALVVPEMNESSMFSVTLNTSKDRASPPVPTESESLFESEMSFASNIEDSCDSKGERTSILTPEGKGNVRRPLDVKIKEEVIKTRSLLYNRRVSEKLFDSHILNKVQPSRKGAQLLAKQIFLRDGQQHTYRKLPSKLNRAVALLCKCIKNYRKLNIKAVLETCCPLPATVKTLLRDYRKERSKEKSQKSTSSQQVRRLKKNKALLFNVAASSFVEPYKVFLFVKRICQKVFQRNLLGTKVNWRRFFKNIKPFFDLGKNEFMSMSELTNGIKLSLCNWMFRSGKRPVGIQKPFLAWQESTLKSLIRWIAEDFLIPLVRSCFYVTETGMDHDRIFFYRRTSWSAIESLGKDSFFADGFKRVKEKDVLHAVSTGAAFGCGKARFIPKKSKVRPVVNIHWDDKDDKKEMEKVISILKFVKKQRPLVTGCAVSSISEIHHRLLNFSMKLRAMGRLGSKLYFLCSDIERCFDNMPHDKLLEVIRHSLKEKEYLVRNFRTICNVTHGVIKMKDSHAVAAAANCRPFPVFLKENLLSDDIRVRNSVIIDVGDEIRSRNRVISLVTKHVEQSYVQFGNTFYRHIRGVAQGSMLATYYCDFLYGHMEAQFMGDFLVSDNCMLIRWTDDYLLIGTSKEIIGTFVQRLGLGFSQYGFSLNASKSRSNVDSTSLNCPLKLQKMFGEWFGWCNLLINTKTLEVKYNFENYIGGSVGETVTVRLDSRPGVRLLQRLCHHIRTRLSSVVVDPRLNSAKVIEHNLCHIAYLTAKKMDYIVGRLPKDSRPNKHPIFWKNAIHRIFKAFYRHYRRVHQRAGATANSMIPKKVAKNIYFAAIIRVMSTKCTRYRQIMKQFSVSQKKSWQKEELVLLK